MFEYFYIYTIFILLIIIFHLYKFYRRISNYIKNINFNKNNIKTYFDFFEKYKYISEKFKTESFSTYIYSSNKLNTKNVNFFYNIRNGIPDFDGGNFQTFNITNTDLLLRNYNNTNMLFVDDIDLLSKYDNELIDYFKKRGTKCFYLINIFTHNKPFGFFCISYKEITILNDDDLSELSTLLNEITEIIIDII